MEANSSSGQAVTLIGGVPLIKIDTFYARYGDWFGKLVSLAALAFLILTFMKKGRGLPQPLE